MKLSRLLALSAVVIVAAASPVTALNLAPWSDDTGGSDTEPASDVLTDANGFAALNVDHSEDGTIIAATWRGGTPSHTKAAVGFTDGTTVQWSAAQDVNYGQSSSSYHQSVSVSGDGRTVFVTWAEQSLDGGRLDDIMVAVGAISVDANTNTPSVTWAPTHRFVDTDHDWYPTVDSSYDGSKVVITFWDSTSPSWSFNAHTGNVTVSGSTRTTVWKGPATITTPNWDFTPTEPRLQLKVSRDGARATAAWWSSHSPIASGYGRIETSSASLSNSLPFPFSLYGSMWSGRIILSSASNSRSTSPPSLDMNDDGTKAIIAWQGVDGTQASDTKFTAVATANIPTATNPTWSLQHKLYEGATEATFPRVSMSADGTRAMAAWAVRAASGLSSSQSVAFASVDSNGAATWMAPTTTTQNAVEFGYHSARMSRDGATAVSAVNGRSPLVVATTATNVWGPSSGLLTDWEASLTQLSTSSSQATSTAPHITIGHDGGIVTVVWTASTKLWMRTASQAAPTVTGINPPTDDAAGGTLVTVTGSGFRPGLTIQIGGMVCANPTRVSSTQATCIVGTGTDGTHNVVVTNIDGRSGTSIGAFTYTTTTTTTTTTTVDSTTTTTPVDSTTTNTSVDPISSTTVAGPSGSITTDSVSSTTVAAQSPSIPSTTTPITTRTTPPVSTTSRNKSTPTTTSTTVAIDPDVSPDDDGALAFASPVAPRDGRQIADTPSVKIDALKVVDFIEVGLDGGRRMVAGRSLGVSAAGFEPNEDVQVILDDTSPKVLTTTTANDAGTASVDVTIPNGISGQQTLAMYAPGSGIGYRTTFTVESVESSSSTQWWMFAVGILGAGLVWFWFIIWRRRDDEEEEESLLNVQR